MQKHRLVNLSMILLAVTLSFRAAAQPLTCGQKQVTEALINRNSSYLLKSAQLESAWRTHLKTKRSTGITPLGNTITTLPVVVHVIHDNGPENISDAQVLTAIQHLNEGYANSGYYDPADGADTRIQFCLAQHDPANQPTNGITHDVSPYTNMSGNDPVIDDLHVKDVRRWNPLCYINIWVVRNIPGSVAGYAYLPPAHGSDEDGIVVEAGFFGTSYANDVVLIHEMGHYLGLYHTFEGGCTNNDCSLDGDRICDTPPDQSTAYVTCGQPMNSCSTDQLSGFSTDENDLTKDYMDYGNIACMTIFTPDQVDRMNWTIQNIRMSLLACKSCMQPCPAPVIADFSAPPGPIAPGATVPFTNTSVNASAYTWYVNGTQQSTNPDLSYLFPAAGLYTIRLIAASGDALCVDAEKDLSLQILCPAVAAFTPADTSILMGGTAHFIATGSNANSWQWWLDGVMVGTGSTYDETFPIAGSHAIRLVAGDGVCSTETIGHLQVVDPADSCSIHTFQKSMPGPRAESSWETVVDGGGNYLVTGITTAFGLAPNSGYVMKLSAAGVPLWAETVGDLRSSRFHSVKSTADGGSIHGGVSQGANGSYSATLCKLDAQGGLQWAKKYTDPLSSLSIIGRALPLSDGGYLLSACLSGLARPLRVMRTDANGNLLWAKSFLDGVFADDVNVLEDNGRLVLSISGESIATLLGGRGMVLALDAPSGNLIWAKYYDVPGSDIWTGKIYPYQGNYLMSVFYETGRFGTLLVDQLGNPVSAYKVQDGSATGSFIESDVAVAADQTLTFFCGETSAGGDEDAALIKISADGKLISARKYPQPLDQTLFSLRPTPDKGYIGVGNFIGTLANNGLYFLKTDSALRLFPGANGCPSVEFQPAIVSLPVTATPFTSTPLDANITTTDYQPQVTHFVPPMVNSCEDPAACSLLAITGRDTACTSADSLIFTATRNRDCSGKPVWTVDDPAATINPLTDSTVSLHFKNPGRMLLHARMTAGCRLLADSVWIEVPAAAGTVNLGPDLALCTQSTVQLSAGTGFRSYLWQNGSVDSTQTAYLPGTYWVIATDYCNIPHGDTLVIANTTAPPFTLGPATEVCQGDSIRLTAPAGFAAYHWAPDYRINDPSAATVFLSPLADTVYTCTAVQAAGCTVVDSIRVHVNVCRPGIYFPGAFTPNRDGTNDLYRPVIFGALPVEYYLAIYNREGQLVFETHNPTAGWDGRVRGIPSVTNSFVWYARYRLPGEPEKIDKGLLTLVR